MVEHSTADREVLGSTPSAPSNLIFFYLIVEGETRVIRGCGWIPNEGSLKDRTCFNRAGTKEVSSKCLHLRGQHKIFVRHFMQKINAISFKSSSHFGLIWLLWTKFRNLAARGNYSLS